mgnify:CR=1 FL=1
MLVIPAIDLQGGEAVRLYKGDYKQKTVYSSHPEELAKKFGSLIFLIIEVMLGAIAIMANMLRNDN